MRLIIFNYHAVLGNGRKSRDFYQISSQQFYQQMDHIKDSGFKVVNLKQINNFTNGKRNSNSQVALTFDDGDVSSYEIVEPILRQNAWKAYFFITAGRIGKNGTMNWEQIKSLRDKKHIIGSHGMTHRILTQLTDREVELELKDSKKILEDNLGIPVRCLSIPRGFHNEKIIQKAKDLGYEAIFTSELGVNTDTSLNLLRLNRISIKRSLSFERFVRILGGKNLMKEKIEDAFKKSAKVLLGSKNYEKITLKAYK
ncbi:polysaccharide deacetylase family protein [Candidatus Omnitrophota bacterium]